MTQIAKHEPAADSNFVIRVDLSDHGMPGRGEQLWAKQVAPTRFLVRSLPFFAYGLHAGDEVETGDDFVVTKVVARSGRRLLRVAADRTVADRVTAALHPVLEQLHLSHEWHQAGYVAVDIPDETVPEGLRLLLDDWEAADQIQFEVI